MIRVMHGPLLVMSRLFVRLSKNTKGVPLPHGKRTPLSIARQIVTDLPLSARLRRRSLSGSENQKAPATLCRMTDAFVRCLMSRALTVAPLPQSAH